MKSSADVQPEAILAHYAPAVEAEMRALLAAPDPALATLYTMFQYHLGWVDAQGQPISSRGGKMIRPAFCLLTAEAVAGHWEPALPAAAAIELVHNFSLIHDDVEDGDVERRGRPTVWAVWGQPHAINAGDAVFVLARLALSRLADRGISPARLVTATQAFDRACLALCHGQFLDLSFETRLDVTVDEYLAMVRGKTAALLGLSAHLGALLSSDNLELATHYRRFGEELGVAFQLFDDVLGIWGERALTGKPTASDVLRRKKSFPVIHAMERVGERLRRFYRQPTISPDDLPAILALLEETDARTATQIMAESHHLAALEELAATGIENPAQDALRSLASFLIHRSY